MLSACTAMLVVSLAWAEPSGAVSVAVFGDNATDEFLNGLPGVSAVVVTDAQLSTPGFLDDFDAFYYTRNGTNNGTSLSRAAAATATSASTRARSPL